EIEIVRIHNENSNEMNNKNNQIKTIVEDYEKEIDRRQNENNCRIQEICDDYENEIARLNAIISEHSVEMSLVQETNKELELYRNETRQNYILVRKAWKSYFKK
ncbi:hypothetical protein, partial [Paenibacillus helianthi]|uniref:hypothetical protein n=1 Tax=Paenibacillus helianthi TaxID=1349432 RepID=UPI000AD9DD95